MSLNFHEYQSKAHETRVRVEITKATQARPIGEDIRPVQPGEVILVSQNDAYMLRTSDAAKIIEILSETGTADAVDASYLRSLLTLPVHAELEAMPSHWRDLPKAFADAWVQLAQFRKLQSEAGEWASRSVGRRAIGERAVAALGVLHQASEEAQNRVRNFDKRALWGASREASRHVVAVYGEYSKIAEEVHETARAIFAERVRALDLADWKVEELYRGSMLRVQADKAAPPKTAPNLRMAFDATGEREALVDASIEALASYYISVRQAVPGIKAFRDKLKGDLAKALKVARKAA